jgi:hypothetical protein
MYFKTTTEKSDSIAWKSYLEKTVSGENPFQKGR